MIQYEVDRTDKESNLSKAGTYVLSSGLVNGYPVTTKCSGWSANLEIIDNLTIKMIQRIFKERLYFSLFGSTQKKNYCSTIHQQST